MAEPKYKRVLIKLSGEALAGERGVGIDLPTVQAMAKEIAEVADTLRSGWITTGPKTKELERRLSLYTQTPKTVCLTLRQPLLS